MKNQAILRNSQQNTSRTAKIGVRSRKLKNLATSTESSGVEWMKPVSLLFSPH